ncbi:hypothetical protein GCM10010458_02770 [Microbacterium luteolum]|uniref:Dinucleotide-utilizing enzyme n=1 Tax=Microbacterium luteolum TaxID=69367 RepID=A0ABY7XQ41_MICLT|nr:hypothetical protein [Microbacterium luteolum]WDM43102.1 hypothetical protein KV395_07465 [Microbacterium luteolum]
MNTSLTRSIGFWLLLVVSLATTAVGGWLISGQIGTMTTTLLDGTATGVEVYVGQSLVVVGAGVLAAGIVGILLTLGLVAARSLVPAPAPAPAVVEAIDWTAEPEEKATPVETASTTVEGSVGATHDAEPAAAADAEPADAEPSDTEAESEETTPAVTR